ncbi:MAG: hypothetical protein COB67_00085 [SAR324 cluster bacterium]|uniref:Phage recombination protein Bet n=1 Tax=SAR324 cluster bacterium TaxID=2024889 RepID=A0A2A4TD43_9DELT|nr:MAG: hypothetical protein COB67_00085 [SAR324 cluster bacterium]
MNTNTQIVTSANTWLSTTLNIDPMELQSVIVNTVMPAGSTPHQVAAFMMVCNTYNLNPLTKEIAAFPTKQAGIMPMVMIDGWLKVMNAHPLFDGYEQSENFSGNRETWSVTTKMYKKNLTRPFVVTEYFVECYNGNTDKTGQPWDTMPRRMLRHKSLIQAIRYALGISGIYDRDELERIDVDPSAQIPHVDSTEVPQAPAVNNYLNGPQPEIVAYSEIEKAVNAMQGLQLIVKKEYGKDIAYVNGNNFPYKVDLNKLGFKSKKTNSQWVTYMDVSLNMQQPTVIQKAPEKSEEPTVTTVIENQTDNVNFNAKNIPIFEHAQHLQSYVESLGLVYIENKGKGESKKFFALAEGDTTDLELELQSAGFADMKGMWIRDITNFKSFLTTESAKTA